MPEDRFERLTAGVAMEVVSSFLPGGGLILAAGRALLGDPNATLRAEIFDQLQDHVQRLQEAVDELRARLEAQGKRIDDLDAIARGRVTEDFLKSMTGTASPQRREALTWATARLFDPTFGTFAFRNYWLTTVSQLDDAELETIRMMSDGAISVGSGKSVIVGDPNAFLMHRNIELAVSRNGAREIDVGPATVAAITLTLNRLRDRSPALVQNGIGEQDNFSQTLRRSTSSPRRVGKFWISWRR